MTSPLDRPIVITTFPDIHARSKESSFTTLRDFGEVLRTTSALTKAELPLFSTCSYDSKRTVKKSLRHDANVREAFCVVGDYDGERVSLNEAADAMRDAGLAGLLVTTPRHMPARPRWRIIVPLSDPLHRDRANAAGLMLTDYPRLVGKLSGVFADTFSLESWTLSQSWYIGGLHGARDHGVLLLDGAGA